MNINTVLVMAVMTASGLLGLLLAARAVDQGMQIFGFVLFGLAVFLDFWFIKRHFDQPVAARSDAD